jgi:coenzyme F420-0:L-glutamate ligase / coenzyme F420-1:gamma-L-glutamate ligase
MPINVDAQEFLRSRRSIRRFTDQAVEKDQLDRIIETGCCAPSAHNSQPWRFAILTSPSPKHKLAEAMASEFLNDLAAEGFSQEEIEKRIERSRSRIQNAPVVVILCLDQTDLDSYPDARRQKAELTMGIQSAAMAGLQLLQAAHAEGLGGVWTCGPLFAPNAVQTALSLPVAWDPQGMLLLGYPDEIPPLKNIKPMEKMVLYIE